MPRKITREAAIKAGRSRFYVGALCKRGHRSERWVANRMCIACKYHAEKTKPEYLKHHVNYRQSPKGKETERRYDQSAKGIERWRRYNLSPKGRQNARDFDHRRRADPIRNRRQNDIRNARMKRQRKALREN